MKPITVSKKSILYILIVVVFFVGGSLIPGFLSIRNLMNIIRQSSIVAICACGMTMVIIIKGIDLSVTGVLSFCAMVNGLLLLQGWPILLAMLAGLLVGTLMGVFNGFMVEKLGIPAFITTLVVGNVGGGLALLLNAGKSIGGFPDAYVFMGNGTILGMPVSNYIMFIFVIATTILMSRTRLGVYIYAMGGNEKAAILSGINTNKILFIAYTNMGFLSAISALVVVSRFNSATPSAGTGYELDAIGSCFIGGASAYGGIGTVGGCVIGAILMGVLNNGMSLLGIDANWQKAVKGLVLLAAVVFDVMSKKRSIKK